MVAFSGTGTTGARDGAGFWGAADTKGAAQASIKEQNERRIVLDWD